MADANSIHSRPSTRKLAISNGDKTYVGSPCPNGHAGTRYTVDGGCVVCRREYSKSKEKKEYDRVRCQLKREDISSKSRARYENNREAKIVAAKQWVSQNPERRRAIAQNYKHRRRAQEDGGISSADLMAWKRSQPKVCYWCGRDCAKAFTVDHYTPLAKGGRHEADNLVIACRPCNVRKNAKDPLEFAASVGRLF